MGRSVQAALASTRVSRVVVSTDDDAIAAAARSHGAEVVRRPEHLAGDTASSESALLHALEQLSLDGPLPPQLVFLQCTSPFTSGEQIDQVLAGPGCTRGEQQLCRRPLARLPVAGRWPRHQPRPATTPPAAPGPRTRLPGDRSDLRHGHRRLPGQRQPVLPPWQPVVLEHPGPEIDTPSDLALCRALAQAIVTVILPGSRARPMAAAADKRLAGRTVAAVACFDSFGKMAMTLLAACRRQGADTTLHLLEINNRALSRRQRLEIRRTDPRTRIEKHRWKDFRQLTRAMAGDVDVLVLGLDGRRSRDALLMLAAEWKDASHRPLLVSAYPGILFRFALEGMLDRSGVDLLCLNSNQDLELYQQGCRALGQDSSNAVVTGLPILWKVPQHQPPRIGPRSSSSSSPRFPCTRCSATSCARS